MNLYTSDHYFADEEADVLDVYDYRLRANEVSAQKAFL